MPPSPRAAGGDLLGALADDVLHLVLSFLPAQDAVRTCVLARRWRDLWKSSTSLRVVRQEMSVKAVRDFVDHFLALRGGSPLHTCELRLSDFKVDDVPHLKLWIKHALVCKARALSLDIQCAAFWFDLHGSSLISDQLRELRLSNIYFEDKRLDLSCCPALEVLEIHECSLSDAASISSRSLKCLSIDNRCLLASDSRNRIYTPNLRSLRLEVGEYRTPLLERMPLLVEASVNLCHSNSDYCDYSADSGVCEYAGCGGCYGINGDTDNCVLLQGLTEARDLTLISDVEIFIFRRDLKFGLIFGNLKSLLLNEYWCVPADFSALAYMLEHSPILEKLTLQLYCEGLESKVKVKGIPDPADRSAGMSEHLKMVEVQCEVVDDKVLDVLKFLTKLGIRFCF